MYRAQLVFAVLFILFANANAAAQETRELSFRVLENATADAQISDICCSDSDRWLSHASVESFRTHYGNGPVWLKIEGISNGGLIQFQPVLDTVTLYTRSRARAVWQSTVTGDIVSNQKKVFESPFMALPLPAELDLDNVYARIDMPMAVSVTARQWSLPAFIEMQNADRTFKTFLLGFIVAIAMYNIVVSGLVRDPVFLVNALSIISLLVTALYLSGYGAAYFWAQIPEMSNYFLIGSILSASGAGGLFAFLFLGTFKDAPHRNKALLAVPVLAALIIVVLLASGAPDWVAQAISVLCAVIFCVVLFSILVFGAVKGDKQARLLMIPFVVAVLPGILLVLLQKIVGLGTLNLGNNTMEITLAIEAMLFSLALASRIRFAEQSSREANSALLEERGRSSALALAAQDNERKRLSKELHDGVGQELLLVVNRLKRLAKGNSTRGSGNTIDELVHSTSGIMESLRRISRDMHPASIDHLGLAGTIEETTAQLTSASQIEFGNDLNIEGLALSSGAQLHLVRIIQELLANVAKHSGATRCMTEMRCEGDHLLIDVDDDGIGLDRENHNEPASFGLGLISIDERVRSLGGHWTMDTSALGGLATRIEIPLSTVAGAGGRVL